MKKVVLFFLFASFFLVEKAYHISSFVRPVLVSLTSPLKSVRVLVFERFFMVRGHTSPGDVILGGKEIGNVFFVTGGTLERFYILGKAERGALVFDPDGKRFLGIVVESGDLSTVKTIFSEDIFLYVKLREDTQEVVATLRGGRVPKVSVVENIDVTGWKVFLEDSTWNEALEEYLYVGDIVRKVIDHYLVDVKRDLPKRVMVVGRSP